MQLFVRTLLLPTLIGFSLSGTVAGQSSNTDIASPDGSLNELVQSLYQTIDSTICNSTQTTGNVPSLLSAIFDALEVLSENCDDADDTNLYKSIQKLIDEHNQSNEDTSPQKAKNPQNAMRVVQTNIPTTPKKDNNDKTQLPLIDDGKVDVSYYPQDPAEYQETTTSVDYPRPKVLVDGMTYYDENTEEVFMGDYMSDDFSMGYDDYDPDEIPDTTDLPVTTILADNENSREDESLEYSYPLELSGATLLQWFALESQGVEDPPNNMILDTVSLIINHGCWCSKLNFDNNYNGIPLGFQPFDDLDKICQEWFHARNCNRGSGHGCDKDVLEISALSELTYHIDSDGCRSVENPSATDLCSVSTCKIDVSYALKVRAHFNANKDTLVFTEPENCMQAGSGLFGQSLSSPEASSHHGNKCQGFSIPEPEFW